MRVLVVGAGSMGRRHVANALALGHEVWVDDPVVQNVERSGGRAVLGEWPEVDACVIASPCRNHAEQFWRAAYHVPKVYVEKPLALSVAQLLAANTWCEYPSDELVDAGHVVGYNLRAHEGLCWVRRQIVDPRSASIHVQCDMATWPGRDYADALLELSHELDLAQWLLGPMTLLRAVHRRADEWIVAVRHASGCITHVHLDGASPGGSYRRGGSIAGGENLVRWFWHPQANEPGWRFLGEVRALSGGPVLAARTTATTPENTYRLALQGFLGGGLGVDTPPGVDGSWASLACPLEQGLAVLELVDKIRANCESSNKTEGFEAGSRNSLGVS